MAISASQGVTILSEADWDGVDQLNDGNNGVTATTTDGTAGLTAPAGSTGEVAQLDSGEANVWGAVNPVGNTIALPAGTVPGTDTFSAQFDVYVPTGTTFSGTDRITMIVRYNNVNAGNANSQHVWSTLAADTWHTISVSGTIPLTDSGGTAVTGLTPILSFYDRTDAPNTEAGVGISAYIDNWSFSVTESIP